MSITFNTENSPAEFDLNVANGNGYMILRDLLDVDAPECWGSIQPATVLARLATAGARLGAGCPDLRGGIGRAWVPRHRLWGASRATGALRGLPDRPRDVG